MMRNDTRDRPTADERTDRRNNAGRPDGLGYALDQAIQTAPEGIDNDCKIARVAWVAWDTGRDPADVWREVDDESTG